MSARGSRIEPRRLAFHLLTALAVVACIVAARWQWDRAHRTEADAVPAGPVVALADLDPTTTYSGMRVRVTGHVRRGPRGAGRPSAPGRPPRRLGAHPADPR